MLLGLLQGPAMVVQECGWVGMLIGYTWERGLRRGVIETLDGEHPCAMCKRAAELRGERDDERPADEPPGVMRLRQMWGEMFRWETVRLPVAPARVGGSVEPGSPLLHAGRLAEAPPVPPPEAAVA